MTAGVVDVREDGRSMRVRFLVDGRPRDVDMPIGEHERAPSVGAEIQVFHDVDDPDEVASPDFRAEPEWPTVPLILALLAGPYLIFSGTRRVVW